MRAVNTLSPLSRTLLPNQLTISLFNLSFPAIEILAVKNLVNHQYNFRAKDLTRRRAPESVPKMVRSEARVVRSSFSQEAKKDLRNAKWGELMMDWSEVGVATLVSARRRFMDGGGWDMVMSLPAAEIARPMLDGVLDRVWRGFYCCVITAARR